MHTVRRAAIREGKHARNGLGKLGCLEPTRGNRCADKPYPGLAGLPLQLVDGVRQPADKVEKLALQLDFSAYIVVERCRRLGQMRPISCIAVLDGAMVA